jgi:cob(I)alamin adenosyltransferase
MVKLNKIYTRTGDDGTTGLVGGIRIRKDNPRVEAYGEVDEANAFLGVALTHCCQHVDKALGEALAGQLVLIQNEMFDLGADLATPLTPDEQPGTRLRIIASQTARLEGLIDQYTDQMEPLNSFVLPGGSPLAAALHAARTVVRRAERRMITLQGLDGAGTNAEAVRYVNRLSDLLFVLARAANGMGKADVLWKPGATR